MIHTCVEVNPKGAPPLHHSAGASEYTSEERNRLR